MNVLKFKNISYQYERSNKKVLRNISANFSRGKMYAIMGKSGVGKSTLLSLIAGLDTCTEGEILFEDKDLKEIDGDIYRAKNIGVIFQGFNLINNATALENIILSMNISGSKVQNKKSYAYSILEKVGIDNETADRKVLKLSGGEQQRVGIARALSHNPNIIIADEPTGNLDSSTEENIMNILRDIAIKDEKCVVIVTHSKSVALYADEVWNLNKGGLN